MYCIIVCINNIIALPPIGERSIDERVCVCVFVCLSAIISDQTKLFVHVTYGRGSVLLWQHSDTLCTSGFMDDAIFAHKPRLLGVAAQLKHSAHAALGVAINYAQ